MMKRFLIAMVITIGLLGASIVSGANKYDIYTYEVTAVNGDEINGVALAGASNDNSGIFLLQSELSVKLAVGDRIAVVFPDGVHDGIIDVKKLK